jgi:myo-inositol 2-dehydrogenase / D-chiro-inositol 1-dehydrogenase
MAMTQTASVTPRREFIRTSSAAVAGTLAALAMPRGVHAAGSETLKIGLVGCGGRGSGAAAQALKADPNVKLWAMADAFEDRLESSLANLQKTEDAAGKIDVAPERRFTGFDAYKHVIEACDVVLLATPPHFRPMHLRAAVDAGKHVFAEKPVAVDAPGVRSVMTTCEEAKRKNLSIVSGLCLRYDYSFQETVKRIHDGAIGQIVAMQANDYRGPIWVHPRKSDWSDMTWQMRNWYYFTWLCGDFNVEQHVHLLDTCSWAIGGYPVQAIATGGRQQRVEPEFGHIFDHFSVTYEYGDGARLFATCRQQTGCANDISAHMLGTKGTAFIAERKGAPSIKTADGQWNYTGKRNQMYQTEHDELFASIRSGKPINNGEYMSKGTLLAIMGRMAAYTGQLITWEQAMNSQEDLSPPRYDWDVKLPVPPVAKPGVTKLV